MGAQALSGVRALDLSDGVAGVYCARMLAAAGAEVIKIEPPGGDPLRQAGPFPNDTPHPERGGLFIYLNGGKRSLTLDITAAGGREVFKRLVEKTDLVVESFAPGYLASLGLGFEALEAVNPSLVMVSITPFGQTGPYSGHRATDVGVFAMSGRMYVHGLSDRQPLPYAPDVIWYQVGATAAAAAVSALFASRFQGVGQQVDVSAQEAVIGNVDSRVLFYEYTGRKTPRVRWPGGIPQGAYPCLDGYVVLGVGYDVYFRRLCDAMGRPDIYADPRWTTAEARLNYVEEFEAIFIEWLMQRTKRDVFELCQAHKVMCAPVLTFQELMDDPQLVARCFFTEAEVPGAGAVPVPGAPFRMSETPLRMGGAAPTLGRHTAEILTAELGYTASEVARLQDEGVV